MKILAWRLWASLAVVLSLSLQITAAQTTARELSLERLYDDPELDGPTLRNAQFSPDGRFVTYIKGKAENARRADLWAYEVATGRNMLLLDSDRVGSAGQALSEVEKARRERQRINIGGVIEYSWAQNGAGILVPIDGDLYYYAVDSGEVTRLTDTNAYETDARLSPQGRYVSFIREQNIWILDRDSERQRRLTKDGRGAILNGMAEFIADEEMDRHTGYWWASDDSAVAFIRVDESRVPLIERYDIGGDGISVVKQRYPRAGAENARVRLGVVQVLSRRIKWVDLGAEEDIYLARVNWLPDNSGLIVQRQSRDQKILDIIYADANSGRTRLLFSETATSWVNLHSNLRMLEGGKKFLWSSERDGFNHLYIYDMERNQLRRLTSGKWAVGQVEAVDEQAGQVYFSSFADTPLEQHLYRVALAGGAPQRLTELGYWNSANVNIKAGAMLVTRSSPMQPPQVGVFNLDGDLNYWILENQIDSSHPYAAFMADHRTPQYGTLSGEDGSTLYYSMTLPKNFNNERRYPVIVDVYGGPGAQRVRRSWGNLLDQLYAQEGFIIFRLDNRGSTNRGKAFEDQLFGKLARIEVADQLTGVAFLREQSFVDGERIGVMGWSYGGYMTLMLLMRHPEAFAAGVSGAPVTDWRLYDTHYTERYLGHPGDNPEGYEASSVLRYADRLERPLLLIHGMADDNVIFAHSTKLMAQLQDKGIGFELMTYPGQTHRIRGKGREIHRAKATLEFFKRHLGQP